MDGVNIVQVIHAINAVMQPTESPVAFELWDNKADDLSPN